MHIFSRHPFRHQSDGEADGPAQLDADERRSTPLWTGLVLLVAAVAFGCWLGFEAFHAKSNLEDARHSAEQAKDALSQGNAEDAAQWVGEAHSHAQAARDATHSLPWNVRSCLICG